MSDRLTVSDPWPDELPTRFQIDACASQHSAWHRPCVHVINEIARLESALSDTAEAVDRLMAREEELEAAIAAKDAALREALQLYAWGKAVERHNSAGDRQTVAHYCHRAGAVETRIRAALSAASGAPLLARLAEAEAEAARLRPLGEATP